MNQKIICCACGTKFPAEKPLPEVCPICEDDRQYVPDGLQTWTSSAELVKNHRVEIRKLNENLYELKLSPAFAIGQRALLVLAPEGNILWDLIPLFDESAVSLIKSKGGLKAIAFSHPHFYSNMSDWAEKFDCLIYIHEADEKWIVNKTERVNLWNGLEKELWSGMKIHNIGGHFAGSSILELASSKTILCGDTLVISPSKKHLAAMHSYPNKIPLPIGEIARIKERMKPIEFDTLHAWHETQSIETKAKEVLDKSLARYA
ncbi:MAG: hypothetical protein R2747_19565 [Pyrinomonadaceae bacterium]